MRLGVVAYLTLVAPALLNLPSHWFLVRLRQHSFRLLLVNFLRTIWNEPIAFLFSSYAGLLYLSWAWGAVTLERIGKRFTSGFNLHLTGKYIIFHNNLAWQFIKAVIWSVWFFICITYIFWKFMCFFRLLKLLKWTMSAHSPHRMASRML